MTAVLAAHLRPGPLEVACGLALGQAGRSGAISPRSAVSPREAIEASVLGALRRPPCLVSFSGGRDSSAVLAAAAAVARREGLPLPVPVTYRIAHAAGSDETEWQEQVVAHLGLAEWERVEVVDDLDVIGPSALRALRRHGLLWPFNAFFHLAIFERAEGGSVLTGAGGDEILGHRSPGLGWIGRAGPGRARLRALGLALAPDAVRVRVLGRRPSLRFPWLHPVAEGAVIRSRLRAQAAEPARWDAAIAHYWRSRYRVLLAANLGVLAAGAGTHLVQPFLDPAVASALSRRFGGRGPVGRTEAMRELFGDLLPEALVARRSKASFDAAFVAGPARQFAQEWDGAGVDPSLVDQARLAATWRDERPDPRSLLLLQQARLAAGP